MKKQLLPLLILALFATCALADEVEDNLTILSPATDTRTDIHVSPGRGTTLSVRAEVKKGNVYYTWFAWEGGIICENPNYTIEQVTALDTYKPDRYTCIVWDDFGNRQSLSFAVYVDNGLYAARKGEKYRFVNPGESVNLSLNTSVIRGRLDFTWKDYNGSVLSSNRDSITVTAPDKEGEYTYSCKVKDEYGNVRRVSFVVVVGRLQEFNTSQPVTVQPGAPEWFGLIPEVTGVVTISGQYVSASGTQNNVNHAMSLQSRSVEDTTNITLYDKEWNQLTTGYGSVTWRLIAGEHYYYRTVAEEKPVQLTLDNEDRISGGEYTLLEGQRVRVPDLDGYTVEGYETKDTGLLSVTENSFTALSPGTAELLVYGEAVEVEYTINVISVPVTGVLTLPENLSILGPDAFSGVTKPEYLVLSEGLEVLSTGMLSGLTLKQLTVTGSDTVIESGELQGRPLILCQETNSEGDLTSAAEYAYDHELPLLFLVEDNND